MSPDKIMNGLSAYIMELDSLRPPLIFGISSQSLTNIFELIIKQPSKSYLIKNKPDLQKKVVEKMRPYRTDTQVDSKEMIRIMVYFISMVIAILAISFIITLIYDLSRLQGCLVVLVITIPTLYLFFAYSVTWRRNSLGSNHDEDIKLAVQELINFGREFVQNEALNPENHAIKVRHTDYGGLNYDKIDKNSYMGCLK